jgi:hypothetical protein
LIRTLGRAVAASGILAILARLLRHFLAEITAASSGFGRVLAADLALLARCVGVAASILTELPGFAGVTPAVAARLPRLAGVARAILAPLPRPVGIAAAVLAAACAPLGSGRRQLDPPRDRVGRTRILGQQHHRQIEIVRGRRLRMRGA